MHEIAEKAITKRHGAPFDDRLRTAFSFAEPPFPFRLPLPPLAAVVPYARLCAASSAMSSSSSSYSYSCRSSMSIPMVCAGNVVMLAGSIPALGGVVRAGGHRGRGAARRARSGSKDARDAGVVALAWMAGVLALMLSLLLSR